MKKVAIVGTGVMGTTHADAWQQTDAVIHACASKNDEEAKLFSEKYGARIFPDLESLLPEVDIVDICVPTHLHHKMVLKAAAAGKDILCEKPLSLLVEEGVEMIKACRDAGVKLLVGHVVRFFPEYASARDQVCAGEVGNTAVIRLSREAFQPHNAADNWYIDVDRSGGLIQDLMIHDLDYARWVAGDVVKVYAKNLMLSTDFKGPFDHAMVILTHANGTITHVEGSWAMPKPMFRTTIEIAGSAGLITYDSGSASPIQFALHKTDDDEQSVGLPGMPMTESPYTTQIKEFYNAIINNSDLRVTAEDGLAAVQIARAAIESAKTGKAVDLKSLEEVLA
ncbi:MAG: Gfo/Idh/MocA family oxidoreductase [Anaerolineaceae bacterium]|nr:Gfo/Idh/MocA family oxidoreductase [Anaerolineaceae bacterium]